MTAEQQGQCGACGHDIVRHGPEAAGCIECICLDPAPSSTPPARDSGQFTPDAADVNLAGQISRVRDEAREAVAGLRERIAANAAQSPAPGCCGATSSSDCHQMGLCLMDGRHPQVQRERDQDWQRAHSALALWLLTKYPDAYEDWGASERVDADELLALPELAAILTAPRRPPHSSR